MTLTETGAGRWRATTAAESGPSSVNEGAEPAPGAAAVVNDDLGALDAADAGKEVLWECGQVG